MPGEIRPSALLGVEGMVATPDPAARSVVHHPRPLVLVEAQHVDRQHARLAQPLDLLHDVPHRAAPLLPARQHPLQAGRLRVEAGSQQERLKRGDRSSLASGLASRGRLALADRHSRRSSRPSSREDRGATAVARIDRRGGDEAGQPPEGRCGGPPLAPRCSERLAPLAQRGRTELKRRVRPAQRDGERAERHLQLRIHRPTDVGRTKRLRPKPFSVGTGDRCDLGGELVSALAAARASAVDVVERLLGARVRLSEECVQQRRDVPSPRNAAVAAVEGRLDRGLECGQPLSIELEVERQQIAAASLMRLDLDLQLERAADER
mmetsp:Transcript_10380/g.33035  ORF Transcript_10380/g.33035 Transcript_10380/m.33035 type:complete len:322 (-) Transcript_10380:247-1212(-)